MKLSEAEVADDERVLLLPATRRDGDVTSALLRRAQIACLVCQNLDALTEQIAVGVGAVMLTDTALADSGLDKFLSALDGQPAWSEIPVLVLARDRDRDPPLLSGPLLRLLTGVTVLDRPTSMRSVVSSVRSSLRARRRQYQMREQLIEQGRAEQALRVADRRKDEFLATLAHELRNPLAPIRTGLELLQRLEEGSAQSAKVRSMMERQVRQLVKLTDELLDVSRITTGKVMLVREPVDLRDVVKAALETSQPDIDAGGHEVKTELPDEAVWVMGDASRLVQVVSNLLNNAAKYTRDPDCIDVALCEQDGEAVLTVSDNGAGIPCEMVDDVFEVFTQVDRTLDRSRGGLGIGLSLVRRLVELHGGTVCAQSAGLDAGSVFTVRLPLATRANAVPTTSTEAGMARPRRSGSRRVLIVDDNVDAADLLASSLALVGHQIRTAYNGQAALRAAIEFAPEFVVCDIGMPGMSGLQVASHLRANGDRRNMVLIALTGWGSESDKQLTEQAGFDFHLVKPVDGAMVESMIASVESPASAEAVSARS